MNTPETNTQEKPKAKIEITTIEVTPENEKLVDILIAQKGEVEEHKKLLIAAEVIILMLVIRLGGTVEFSNDEFSNVRKNFDIVKDNGEKGSCVVKAIPR